MRRLAFLAAALLALAGCAAKEEGRECLAHPDCPTGQACGASGKCTKAAAACANALTLPNCRIGERRCNGTISVDECQVDGGAECSAFVAVTTCTPSVQECSGAGAGPACVCLGATCAGGVQSYCDGKVVVTCGESNGLNCETSRAPACGAFEVCNQTATAAACGCGPDLGCGPTVPSLCVDPATEVQCVQDGTALGCWHPSTTTSPCGAHRHCSAAAGAPGACTCDPTTCSPTVSSFCDPGAPDTVVTCANDGRCDFAASSQPCLDGKVCTPGAGSASCACPPTVATPADNQPCAPGSAPACGGTTVFRCEPLSATSACSAWRVQDACGGQTLSCENGACACPAATGNVFHADATSGSPSGGALVPTGAPSPPQCRFRSIEDALLAANGAAGGGEVRAVGGSAIGPMTFVTTGALALSPGVTVRTDDATPTPASYAIEAPGTTLAGAFIELNHGASLSGFTLKPKAGAGSAAAAVATACPGVTDASPVLLDGIRVEGGGRFAAGVSHAGNCPVTVRAAEVQGAGSGIDLLAGSLAVEGGAFSGNVTHVRAHPGLSATVHLSVTGTTLVAATDSAVSLNRLSAASTLLMRDNVIRGNAATTPWAVGSVFRRGGGVVFSETLPAVGNVVFRGNLLSGNSHDQVLVAVSSGRLDLSGGLALQDCGTTPSPRNVFHCYFNDGSYVGMGVYSGTAQVDAPFNEWTNQPAVLGVDYFGNVQGNAASCVPNLPPTCP